MLGFDLPTMMQDIKCAPQYRVAGKLRSATGLLTCDLPAALGDHCEIMTPRGKSVLAEVVGFADRNAYLVPFEYADDLHSGLTVVRKGHGLLVPTGPGALGRVIDGLGRPIDRLGPLVGCPRRPINGPPPSALDRQRIREPFVTGQRAVDSLLTCGRGQRVGIFAGSGVGKSTLLGEIAKGSEADINVIALIGERGREVGPFLEDCLGPKGFERSVVIVATCEQTPIMRVRAAQAAIAVASDFRDRGNNVLFMLDSLTRLAMAQREIGLMLGEPPSARGYTPSVFQLLATTVERLGNASVGGITALLTVLVDGDDMEEPVSDAVRSLVDGHIVLDRRIAESGRYPAIDVPRSISRVINDITTPEHLTATRKIRAVIETHAQVKDLIRVGAYVRGASPAVDRAVELMPEVERFLRQHIGDNSTFENTRRELLRLAAAWPY